MYVTHGQITFTTPMTEISRGSLPHVQLNIQGPCPRQWVYIFFYLWSHVFSRRLVSFSSTSGLRTLSLQFSSFRQHSLFTPRAHSSRTTAWPHTVPTRHDCHPPGHQWRRNGLQRRSQPWHLGLTATTSISTSAKLRSCLWTTGSAREKDMPQLIPLIPLIN